MTCRIDGDASLRGSPEVFENLGVFVAQDE